MGAWGWGGRAGEIGNIVCGFLILDPKSAMALLTPGRRIAMACEEGEVGNGGRARGILPSVHNAL